MVFKKTPGWMVSLGMGLALYGGSAVGRLATAQPPLQETSATTGTKTSQDKFQRSAKIYYYRWFAESGSARGEEIYFFKCWMCHNEYTIKVTAPNSAPTLKDLYKRPRLLSGEPVNDETVAEKIRNGGLGMPAYRYV